MVRHRDTGVQRAFSPASGMSACRRGDRHRAGGLVALSLLCRPNCSVSGCLRGSCPGLLPDNFHLEVLVHHHQRGRSLSRVTRCVAAAKLELSDPVTAPHPRAKPRCPLCTGHSLVAVIITTTATRRPAVGLTLRRPLPRRGTRGSRTGALLPRCAPSLRTPGAAQCTCSGLPASDLGRIGSNELPVVDIAKSIMS